MLKPDYFNGKESRLLAIYQKIEDFILRDIARRLLRANAMTGTADRLIYRLEQLGKSKAAIETELKKYTKASQKELKRLLQDAVLTSWEDDKDTLSQIDVEISDPLENPNVVTVMDAEYQKTQGELENLTRTTMNQSQRDLINLLNEAETKVSFGGQSYNAAINDVLDSYAGRGIMVNYPTGTKLTLESAVRCCVVTSINQTAAQISNQYVIEAGAEYVLVSAHLGARVKRENQPDLAGHDLWQGRVYKIVGSEPGYPNLLDSTGYDIDIRTGAGTVVNPLGLHGYNCRHSHKAWDKRLRNPYLDKGGNLKIDTDENRERYELSQKQRAMERAVRKTKRRMLIKQEEIDAAGYPEKTGLQAEYEGMKTRLLNQNKAYNEFCQKNGLATQYDRLNLADDEGNKLDKKSD